MSVADAEDCFRLEALSSLKGNQKENHVFLGGPLGPSLTQSQRPRVLVGKKGGC